MTNNKNLKNNNTNPEIKKLCDQFTETLNDLADLQDEIRAKAAELNMLNEFEANRKNYLEFDDIDNAWTAIANIEK